MRRLVAAVASGVIVLFGAGCSTDKSADSPVVAAPSVAGSGPAVPSGVPSGAASGAASAGAVNPGDAALAADTGAICNQATRVSGGALSRFAVVSKDLKEANAGKNELAKVQAADAFKKSLQNWRFALDSLHQLVADQKLKADFGKQRDAVDKLIAGDPAKVTEAQIAEINKNVVAACAGK
jgi:hypothetical protein